MPQEVHLYNVISLLQLATLGEREPLRFELGEEVFVALRSHKWTGPFYNPPWRQPSGKWMVSLVNSHTNATSKR